MMKWNMVKIAENEPALQTYLDAGWQPFAVTPDPSDGIHWVWLRREMP